MKARTKTSLVLGMILAIVGIAAVPAQAATGGGCKNSLSGVIRSCISWTTYNGGSLYSDFYVNSTPGCTFNHANMQVYSQGSLRTERQYTTTYVGRYPASGDVRVSVDNNPNVNGSGFTRVQIWDCHWNYVGHADSPVIYYNS